MNSTHCTAHPQEASKKHQQGLRQHPYQGLQDELLVSIDGMDRWYQGMGRCLMGVKPYVDAEDIVLEKLVLWIQRSRRRWAQHESQQRGTRRSAVVKQGSQGECKYGAEEVRKM